MAFAITLINLEDAMKQSGCPLCYLNREVAKHSLESLLWENVNDPATRENINAALGFCPTHTQLLVMIELSNSGPVLGVNLIYEHLARIVGDDLSHARRRLGYNPFAKSRLNELLIKKPRKSKNSIFGKKERCLICKLVDQTDLDFLAALFEDLNSDKSHLARALLKSDGLCLKHLEIGLENFASRYAKAAELLVTDSVKRLAAQSERMKEYIRKCNWEYRAEKMTPEEAIAWKKALTFFTGLPASEFDLRSDKLI